MADSEYFSLRINTHWMPITTWNQSNLRFQRNKFWEWNIVPIYSEAIIFSSSPSINLSILCNGQIEMPSWWSIYHPFWLQLLYFLWNKYLSWIKQAPYINTLGFCRLHYIFYKYFNIKRISTKELKKAYISFIWFIQNLLINVWRYSNLYRKYFMLIIIF